MYLSSFGLKSLPFAIAPDPSRLYLTARHRECLAGLVYAILARKGLIVMTGEVGAGKTIILARLQELLPPRVKVAMIAHPTLSADDFLDALMLGFAITDIPQGKARRLLRLRQYLIQQQLESAVPTLIVDEAQAMSITVMEELRLLSNLEQNCEKLLQIVLVGQSELDGLLRDHQLRHLKQRVAVRLFLTPLSASEVGAYIEHRWTHAGAAGAHPFTPEAVAVLGQITNCIPRLINTVCDNALLLAFAEQSHNVTATHVMEAAEDLDLTPKRVKVAAAATASPAAPLAESPAAEAKRAPGIAREVSPLRTAPYNNAPERRPSLIGRWAQRFRLVSQG